MAASAPLPASTFELTAQRKLRVVCSLWAIFFVLLLITELQDHWDHPGVRWWEPVAWIATSAAAASVWLMAYWRDRSRSIPYLSEPARWLWRQVRWFPLIALVFVPVTYGLRHGLYALLGLRYEHPSWLFVFVYESVKLWLFLGLWLGILFALESFDHWQREQRRLADLQRSLAQAQLLQLKAQLRPHFLFNALNTISSIMHVDVARADRLLNQLANLLRASLRSDQEELTTVRAEVDLLQLYCRIMEERFEDRVSVEWKIDPEASEACLPAMLMQPLLENAFKHGVEKASGVARICVGAQRVDELLEFYVSNVGKVAAIDGEGIGLRNTRARLDLHYGGAARFEFSCNEHGATARVLIPWRGRA